VKTGITSHLRPDEFVHWLADARAGDSIVFAKPYVSPTYNTDDIGAGYLLRLVQIARKAAQAGQIELHKRPLPKGPPKRVLR